MPDCFNKNLKVPKTIETESPASSSSPTTTTTTEDNSSFISPAAFFTFCPGNQELVLNQQQKESENDVEKNGDENQGIQEQNRDQSEARTEPIKVEQQNELHDGIFIFIFVKRKFNNNQSCA